MANTRPPTTGIPILDNILQARKRALDTLQYLIERQQQLNAELDALIMEVQNERHFYGARAAQLSAVLQVIQAETNFHLFHLQLKDRSAELNEARKLMVGLCYDIGIGNCKWLGKILKRDHSSILLQRDTHNCFINTDKAYTAKYRRARAALQEHLDLINKSNNA